MKARTTYLIFIVVYVILSALTFYLSNACFNARFECVISKYDNRYFTFLMFLTFYVIVDLFFYYYFIRFKKIIMKLCFLLFVFFQTGWLLKITIWNIENEKKYCLDNDIIFSHQTLMKYSGNYIFRNDTCNVNIKLISSIERVCNLRVQIENNRQSTIKYYFNMNIYNIKSEYTKENNLKYILFYKKSLIDLELPNKCNCENYFMKNDFIELYKDSLILYYKSETIIFRRL